MQPSTRFISKNRRGKKVSFLVTGATGFLGSHLMVELLKRGYSVTAMCRPHKEKNAQQRIFQILRWFGLDPKQLPGLTVVEGFISQRRFGLPPKDYDFLLHTTDEIFHCAANTSFAERKRDEIEKVNLLSLENVLEMAVKGGCYFFHHISTAFTVGKRSGQCEEDIVETTEFTNVYEETKHQAEKMALKTCRDHGIRLNIYRPSIVYGDSQTGKSFRFNALYYPIKLIHTLKSLYECDIEEKGGKAAAKMGVNIDKDGQIYLPIRLKNIPGSGLNLIPIDYFVEACLAIMEENLKGDIFHIVNDKTCRLEKLIRYTQKFFGIRGIEALVEENTSAESKNPLNALIKSYLAIYMPYMQDTRDFIREKSKASLKKHKISCPEFNYEVFERCVKYALDTDWGKELFV